MLESAILNIVFLPAMESGNQTFGTAPDRIEAYPDAAIHHIHYPAMVWYNAAVRREAIAQIRSLDIAPIILVGFSKSGLGAWNIARAIPERIACTIIFDAPVARAELPPWGTNPFYKNDDAWRKDLPIRTISAFQAAMPETHLLILISGANFHGEMCAFSQALSKAGAAHVFLPRPHLRHHWLSGWIEEGLSAMLRQGL